jgi:hypothetical protein
LFNRKNAGYGVGSCGDPGLLAQFGDVLDGIMRLGALADGVGIGVFAPGVLCDDDARELSLLRERLDDEGDSGTPRGDAPDILSDGVWRRRLSRAFALFFRARRFCSLEADQRPPRLSGEVAVSEAWGAASSRFRFEDEMVTIFGRIRGCGQDKK